MDIEDLERERPREGRRIGETWRISSELITDCGPHSGPEPEGNKLLNTSKLGSFLLLLFDINQHSHLTLRFQCLSLLMS